MNVIAVSLLIVAFNFTMLALGFWHGYTLPRDLPERGAKEKRLKVTLLGYKDNGRIATVSVENSEGTPVYYDVPTHRSGLNQH